MIESKFPTTGSATPAVRTSIFLRFWGGGMRVLWELCEFEMSQKMNIFFFVLFFERRGSLFIPNKFSKECFRQKSCRQMPTAKWPPFFFPPPRKKRILSLWFSFSNYLVFHSSLVYNPSSNSLITLLFVCLPFAPYIPSRPFSTLFSLFTGLAIWTLVSRPGGKFKGGGGRKTTSTLHIQSPADIPFSFSPMYSLNSW